MDARAEGSGRQGGSGGRGVGAVGRSADRVSTGRRGVTARRNRVGALRVAVVVALAAGTGAVGRPAAGQEPPPVVVGGRTPGVAAVARAAPVQGAEPVVDGRLDDPAWAAAEPITRFVQTAPSPGAEPTESTRVRVLAGADALFVAFEARDGSPGEVVGQLTRRDAPSYSDRVHVVLDSYLDRRTAYHFAVNPVGVKWDAYRFDDVAADHGWDPVWEVGTAVGEEGWTAEFRIPYTQLRFDGAPEQRWGVDFYREIARKNEEAHWAPVPADGSAYVSRFGELRGLDGIASPPRLEVVPYTVASIRDAAVGPDAVVDPGGGSVAFGADAKVGIGAGLTLDLTANPDFGQVEADPGQVNLGTSELFFAEKRPFFLEGAGLFGYPLHFWSGSGDQLFYSRRVGRAPGRVPDAGEGEGIDAPERTTILGAAKLTGRTGSGWTVGGLAAVTQRETARVTSADGAGRDVLAEPLATYAVARVAKESADGGTTLGAMATAALRPAADADAVERPRRAWTGGLDVRRRFGDDRYRVVAGVAASRLEGSAGTIEAVQRSGAHFFQRPGGPGVDPLRTSLEGWNGHATVERFAGGFWRWQLSGFVRSPGFDANDVGFSPQAGVRQYMAHARYERVVPGPWFRRLEVGGGQWGRQGTEGAWEWNGVDVYADVQLPNWWTMNGGVSHTWARNARDLLRGGPTLRKEPSWNVWVAAASDARRSLQLRTGGWRNWSPADGTDAWSLSTTLAWRPSGRASVEVGGRWSRNLDPYAWVGRTTPDADARFVLGDLEQSTAVLTARASLAFTPSLSLELYAEPFLSAGRYDDFLETVAPGADRLADRHRPVDAHRDGDDLRVDFDRDGTADATLGVPDFNARQLAANLVFRWEYRPGSTLFLVWTHGRTDESGDGRFGLSEDVDRLFRAPADQRLILKASYWIGG